MGSIAVNVLVLLMNGIPQSLLTVLALYIFTRTKIDIKKYLLLSLIFVIATYLVRFLPIALGVNTVLSLFILILTFQFAYKTQLSKVIRTIASASGIFILIAVSEVLNMLFLIAIYDRTRAEELFSSKEGLVRGIYTSPTNIFFAILIFLVYLILRTIEKRKKINGEAGKKTGV